MTAKLSVRVENFTRRRSNTLIGFVDLLIPELRLRIREATIHEANGRRWVGLPGKPVLDEAARHKREPNGKWVYVPMAEWRDRDASDRFSAAVLEILKQKYPHALDGEDAP